MATGAYPDQYGGFFRIADTNQDGKISGQEAVMFLKASNLPKDVLARIWSYVDENRTGFIGRVEFENCSKLVTVAQSGQHLTSDRVQTALLGPAANKIPPPNINMVEVVGLVLAGHKRELEAELEKTRSDFTEVQNVHYNESRQRQKAETELSAKLKAEGLFQAERNRFEEELVKKNIELRQLERLLKKEKDQNEELKSKQSNIVEEFVKFRQWVEDQASSNYNVVNFTEFTIEELIEATNNFDKEHKIGEGGYGSVYKTVLHDKLVAIKRLNKESGRGQGESEFNQEVEILKRMRHPNLVTLVGACYETWTLVYEYVPNGSLEDHLSKEDLKNSLTWETRIQIALNICSALIFLHSTKPHGIAHGDLKPANILLDSNYVCKLGDFGISRNLNMTSSTVTPHHWTGQPRGTFWYMDQEYIRTGLLTPQSDVYAFGIVLLQLITGKGPMGLRNSVEENSKKRTIANVAPIFQKMRWDKVLDASAKWPLDVAKKLAQLGLRCSDPKRKKRPDLANEVLVEIKSIHRSASGAN